MTGRQPSNAKCHVLGKEETNTTKYYNSIRVQNEEMTQKTLHLTNN